MNKWLRKNLVRLRHRQGCLTDCVAFYLNLHPWKVPYFVYPRNGWLQRLKAFFKRHGYKVYWVSCFRPPKRGTHIVCGNSLRWKTYAHVVVYHNGRVAYDPDYPSRWNLERL